MATHSSTLAQKIPWTGEPSPWGRKESGTTERLHFHFLSLSLSVVQIPLVTTPALMLIAISVPVLLLIFKCYLLTSVIL